MMWHITDAVQSDQLNNLKESIIPILARLRSLLQSLILSYLWPNLQNPAICVWAQKIANFLYLLYRNLNELFVLTK